MKKKSYRRKGSILLQLLIVIAISGLLISIAIINFREEKTNIDGDNYKIVTPEETYITDSYDEDDGCITFGKPGKEKKVCGNYIIEKL